VAQRTAVMWLGATSAGGLTAPLPSGTRSMLLYFVGERPSDPIGVAITTVDGEDLSPDGRSRPVSLEFWVPEAEWLPDAGSVFAVWYSRFVGAGVLTD
jgi:hypothetical protein